MIDVIFTPAALRGDLSGAQVVVLDVLRASSTIVTALANGAREVRLYDSIDAARAAHAAWRAANAGPCVLGGEQRCVQAPGFDLGNSPREYATHAVGGAVVFLATTNGTRAAVAAQQAGTILIGSLLNAGATAEALVADLTTRNTVLLCAGTNGALACEDVLGAGAILFSILSQTYRPDLPFTDAAWLAYHAFSAVRERLRPALRLGQGGINVIEAGLEDDIDVCAALDSRPLVAEVVGGVVRKRAHPER